MSLSDQKQLLRSQMKEQRISFGAQMREEQANSLAQHAKEESRYVWIKKAKAKALAKDKPFVIASYYPFGAELNPRPLIRIFANEGATLALPCMQSSYEPLLFRRYKEGDTVLAHPQFGVKEPLESAEMLIPDLICVPLLACDAKKNRLGYGGGYYDRTLETYSDAISIGLAYSWAFIDHVPCEEHDRPLDAIWLGG